MTSRDRQAAVLIDVRPTLTRCNQNEWGSKPPHPAAQLNSFHPTPGYSHPGGCHFRGLSFPGVVISGGCYFPGVVIFRGLLFSGTLIPIDNNLWIVKMLVATKKWLS